MSVEHLKPDPRPGLGIELVKIKRITGFRMSHPVSPALGGTMDLGIIAELEDGRQIAVGELWAAMTDASGAKVSLDNRDTAARLMTLAAAESEERT